MNDASSSLPVTATSATPMDIDTSKGLVGNFSIVARHVACNIVRLCQKTGNWTTPISFEELAHISSEHRGLVYKTLYELCEGGFLHAHGNGERWFYAVTERFVAACALPRECPH